MNDECEECRILKEERDAWRDCVERMVWSAPLAFAADPSWMKALIIAKKLTEKHLARRETTHLLDNNNKI